MTCLTLWMSPLASACLGRHIVSTAGSNDAAVEIRNNPTIPLVLDAFIFTSAASSVTLVFDRTFLHMAGTSGGQNPPNKNALQAIRSVKIEPASDVVRCRGKRQPQALAT